MVLLTTASLFRLGQLLKGKASIYTITKQLHESIWLATYMEIYFYALESEANRQGNSSHQGKQTVVIKSVRHFRLDNERDVLKRFQSQTPSLRPLIDEIDDPPDPPALVLRHLGDDLLNASAAQRLTSPEIKYVVKQSLEALRVLHENGYVHTGIIVTWLHIKHRKILIWSHDRY